MTRVAIAGVAAFLACVLASSAAGAAPVAVLVVPASEVWAQADRGAVGLFVPGAGASATRRQALRSLTTGRSVSGLAGEEESEAIIRIARRVGPTTIYVALPPPGRHHNVRRYPVAVVGKNYRGILHSRSTRLPGLVSIADIAPTALAFERGRQPVLGFRAGSVGTLRELDRRLTRAHDSRTAATAGLAALLASLTAAALATRARLFGRAALLAPPAAITIALALSAAAIWSPLAVGSAIALGGTAIAVAAGRRDESLPPLVTLFLAAFLIVLAAFPETNALAAIGPHPDGGVRFFGVTNQVETLLLAPVLAAAATSRRWLLAVGLLALVALGWSRAGADGGGVLVLLAGLGTLAVRAGVARLSTVRTALAGAGALGIGLLLVAIDAALGGSSHVTAAVGTGPSGLAEDLRRRLDVSWAGATASWHAGLLCISALAILALIALRARNRRVTTAFLIALAVSLVVNDSPVDELAWGALGAAALLAWETAPNARRFSSSVPRASPAPSLPSE
ncbi:MAG TPA: hypothetical protein VM049_06015 [Gaiellaceae bacterium]|nr:hypothetical protein [Gaiellaceae bacterium]